MTLVGVRRRSVSSTMSTLRQYFSESTHRCGLCVFQAPETMAAHHRIIMVIMGCCFYNIFPLSVIHNLFPPPPPPFSGYYIYDHDIFVRVYIYILLFFLWVLYNPPFEFYATRYFLLWVLCNLLFEFYATLYSLHGFYTTWYNFLGYCVTLHLSSSQLVISFFFGFYATRYSFFGQYISLSFEFYVTHYFFFLGFVQPVIYLFNFSVHGFLLW